jgi:hypothetical protein
MTEAVQSTGRLVEVIKLAEAAKLSPRAGGRIGYTVGRLDGQLYLRIARNDSGGQFSKEWLALSRIKLALPPDADAKPFPASIFVVAFRQRSQNNAGFLVGIMRAEGILEPAQESPTQSVLVRDLEEWAGEMLALETIRTEPLVPEKKGPPKAKKDEPRPDETEFTPPAETADHPPISAKAKGSGGKRKGKGKKSEPSGEPEEGHEDAAADDGQAEPVQESPEEEAG